MSRPRVILSFGAGGLVVAVLAIALFARISQNRWEEELQAFEAKYRGMGYPVTLGELKVAHQVPEGEANAADEYLLAFEKMTDKGFDFDLIPIVGEAEIEPGELMSREMFSEVSAYLAANEEAFVHLRRAAAIPLCRFSFDFDDPYGGVMPSNPYGGMNRRKYMRHTARLLALNVLYAVEEANADRAIAEIRSILLLSEAELQQSTFLSYSLARAISGIGFPQIQTTLSRLELSDGQLDLLYSAVDDLKQAEDYRRIFLREYVMAEADFTRIDKTPLWQGFGTLAAPDYWMSAGSMGLYRLVQFDIHDRREMLNQFDTYLRALDEPLFILPSTLADVEQDSFYSPFILGNMRETSALTMVNVSRVFLFARVEYDSALAAIAIERFRNAEGSIPSTLRALVPEYLDSVPTDPFAGEPLRYKQDPKGYAVYSVGMDHMDEGGYDFETNESPGDDHAIVVHRP